MKHDDRSKPRDDGLPSVDIDSHEGFFGRWSRLKTGEHAQHTNQGRIDKDSAVNPSPQSGEPPERHPTDADMPPIESLNKSSDYSGFMSPKVSEELRRLALRKLFQLPVFNIRDGLDDYDEDFRSFEVLKDVITADMRHQMERTVEQDGDLTEQARNEEVQLTGPEKTESQEIATMEQQSTSGEADAAESPVSEEEKPGPSSS